MDKGDVKDQTNLVRRGSIYYLRARIPADLREHYGKAEVWRSLRTSTRTDALERVRLERIKLDQEFNHARAVSSALPVEELSDLEIDRIAALWHAQLLEEDELFRMEGPSDREFEKYGETLAAATDMTAHQLARGQVNDEWLEFEMGDFLDSHGIKVSSGTDTWRKLSFAFLKTYRKALDAKRARQDGQAVDTPKPPPVVIRSAVPRDGDTLHGLFEYWKTQGEKRPRTEKEALKAVNDFIALNGNLPASRIEKTHVVAYKDSRLAAGKASATVLKNLNLLKAILETAVTNNKLASNPANGVTLAKSRGEQRSRTAFDLEDLEALFHSPVFTQRERPKGGAGEAAFWFPLIALFTGMREDEIGQLDVKDVRQEAGGWHFHVIHDPKNGRHVKEGKTKRAPVHPELVKCGLLDYVEQMRAAGTTKLFPMLSSAPGRQLTASWSQWFGRYLRSVVKLSDKKKVFHSFRHTFKHTWRECGLPEDMQDAITGHSNPSIGRRYGKGLYPLKPLLAAMSDLQYEGLDLAHLYARRDDN